MTTAPPRSPSGPSWRPPAPLLFPKEWWYGVLPKKSWQPARMCSNSSSPLTRWIARFATRAVNVPLQNQTMAFGSSDSRFLLDEKSRAEKHFPLGDLIILDRERCIQCARCVRFQDQVVDDPVIGFYNRGSASWKLPPPRNPVLIPSSPATPLISAPSAH